MAPGCVFRPQSSAQLANGIKALVGAGAEFAVRGGGHMGIRVGLGNSYFNLMLTVAGIKQYQ
jgi:hypothetical protein